MTITMIAIAMMMSSGENDDDNYGYGSDDKWWYDQLTMMITLMMLIIVKINIKVGDRSSLSFYPQAGHFVTVYEKNDRCGGLLMYGIPSMKLDKKVSTS